MGTGVYAFTRRTGPVADAPLQNTFLRAMVASAVRASHRKLYLLSCLDRSIDNRWALVSFFLFEPRMESGSPGFSNQNIQNTLTSGVPYAVRLR